MYFKILLTVLSLVGCSFFKIIEGDKSPNPGCCNRTNHGKIKLIKDRQSKEKLIVCTNDNGFYNWKAIDVGARVLARWTNNLYYKAKVASISKDLIHIQFDDGDKIIHQSKDISAVIPDTIPSNVEFKEHVIASWKGGNRHYIGFVIEVDLSRGYKVRFDDNKEDWYSKENLRIFPDVSSPHTLGSRVFARWTNGLYYRGFVTKVYSSTVFINYDDGDKITLLRNDSSAVILDKLPACSELQLGQKVIGYWPGRVTYYPGTVSAVSSGYFVKFDDGDKRWNALYEIRTIPQLSNATL